jgi:hypothetical protein
MVNMLTGKICNHLPFADAGITEISAALVSKRDFLITPLSNASTPSLILFGIMISLCFADDPRKAAAGSE